MTEQTTKTPQRALRLRQRLKKKKPKFVRPESWRYVRLKKSWRRPRGLDHKVRLKYDGWPPGVKAGYRGPKATRGLHPSGYREVLVYNAEPLKDIDPMFQAIRIAHTVGKRKRTKIITEARKRKITILNVKTVKEAAARKEDLSEEKDAAEEVKRAGEPKPKRSRAKKRKQETEQQ